MTLLFAFWTVGCSSNDEPKYSTISEVGTFQADEFPGEWHIQSITEKTSGRPINYTNTFTIAPFEVTVGEVAPVKDHGYDYWATNYTDLVSVQTHNGLDLSNSLIGFKKLTSQAFTASHIYEFSLTLKSFDTNSTAVIVAVDFNLSGSTLISKEASLVIVDNIDYSNTISYDEVVITFKKS